MRRLAVFIIILSISIGIISFLLAEEWAMVKNRPILSQLQNVYVQVLPDRYEPEKIIDQKSYEELKNKIIKRESNKKLEEKLTKKIDNQQEAKKESVHRKITLWDIQNMDGNSFQVPPNIKARDEAIEKGIIIKEKITKGARIKLNTILVFLIISISLSFTLLLLFRTEKQNNNQTNEQNV